MGVVQNSYSEDLDEGRVGDIVNTENKDLISRTVEEDIAFGLPVQQGANDNGVLLSAGGPILGISVAERRADYDMFKTPDSARIMIRGVIFVIASVDVNAGDPVHADGVNFTNTGGVAIAGARYDSSASAGALVKVRL